MNRLVNNGKTCRARMNSRQVFIAIILLEATFGRFTLAQQTDIKFALARYNSTGSLDLTFDGDGKVITDFANSAFESIEDVAIQGDGKIVVAGEAGVGFALARYNPNGSLDAAFDSDGKVATSVPGYTTHAFALALQADGKIVVAGYARNIATFNYFFMLARYNPNGNLDVTFDGDGKVFTNFLTGNAVEWAYDLAIQPDGKIVVAGNVNGQFALARYNTNGSPDLTFNSNGRVLTNFAVSTSEGANAVALQSDGKIIAAGSAVISSSYQFALARYNSNGRLDATFDSDGLLVTNFTPSTGEYINDLALQTDGKIVVGGYARTSNGDQFALARYNSNGSLDATFDGDGKLLTNFTSCSSEFIDDIVLQANGRIVAAGWANVIGAGTQFALARYNANGSLDVTFDGDGKLLTNFPTAEERAFAVALQADGKIVAAGHAGVQVIGKPEFEEATLLSPLPAGYLLAQNYPNPFNPTTTIQFDLKEAGHTTLRIYNHLGEEIALLVHAKLPAGQHAFDFDAADLPSGVYFYRLSVNGFSAVKRMTLIK